MDTSARSVPNQTTPSTQTSPKQYKLSASTDQPATYRPTSWLLSASTDQPAYYSLQVQTNQLTTLLPWKVNKPKGLEVIAGISHKETISLWKIDSAQTNV